MKKYIEIKFSNVADLFTAVLAGDVYINMPYPINGEAVKCRLYINENALHYNAGSFSGRLLTPIFENLSSTIFYQEYQPTLADYLAIKPRLCFVWDDDYPGTKLVRVVTRYDADREPWRYKYLADGSLYFQHAVMLTDEQIIKYMENPESLRNPQSCAF